MVNVTKADGTTQPFDKERVIRTCLHMKAPRDIAEDIANKVEKRVYDGMETKQIYQMVFEFIKRYRPELEGTRDLRSAVSMLRSKPDFEYFVGYLMKAEGYEVKMNKILKGRCVDHEIDVIAMKGKENIYIEVKHHEEPHTYTGLNVFLAANSSFDDLVEGFRMGKHGIDMSKAYVVINTKVSDHARRYAECRGMKAIAWKLPADRGLERMIEDHKLYPVTMLKDLNPSTFMKLANNGVILLRQMTEMDEDHLRRIAGLSETSAHEMKIKSREIIFGD